MNGCTASVPFVKKILNQLTLIAIQYFLHRELQRSSCVVLMRNVFCKEYLKGDQIELNTYHGP